MGVEPTDGQIRWNPGVGFRSALLLVALAALLPYLPVVKYPFVWDDKVFITQNDAVLHPLPAGNYFTDPETLSSRADYNHKIYRPIKTFVFAKLYGIFGPNPLPFHLLNVVLHGACALMVLLLGRRLCGSEGCGLLAALLFAVHPVHAEAVTWISSLADVLSTAAYLGAILMFVSEAPYARVLGLGVVIPFALLSKEMATTLPVALLAASRWRARGQRDNGPRGDLAYVMSAFGIVGFYIGWRSYVLGAMGQMPVTWTNILEAVLRSHLVLLEYVWMLLIPHPLCPLRTKVVPGAASLLDHGLGVGCLLLLATLAILGLRSKKPFGMFATLFLATLLPVMGFLPVTVHVAERFSYLPSVWFCLIAAEGLNLLGRVLNAKGAQLVLTATLLSALTLKLDLANVQWRSDVAVALAQVNCRHPDPNAYWNLGLAASNAKLWKTAIPAYDEFLTFGPDAAKTKLTLNNLSVAHINLGQWDRAEVLARRCLSSSPEDREALSNLGAALAGKGAHEEALPILLKITERWPDFYPAQLNFAISSIAIGDYATAATHLNKALALRPGDPQAQGLLGWLERERAKNVGKPSH